MIDAGHTYEHIIRDIPKIKKYFNNPIIIIDDYGNPNQTIRKGIEELIENNVITIKHKIGADAGFKTATGLVFNDMEGVICES